MFSNAAPSTPAVPSRNALRVLRQLAFAGSVGTFCTVAAITYDVHRRIRVAEQIIENKRTIRTSAPNYDATASAKRLAVMMEAAEAGEFMGLESLKDRASLQNKTEVPGHGLDRSSLGGDGVALSASHPVRSQDSPAPRALKPHGRSYNVPLSYADPKSKHDNRVAIDREAEQDEVRRAAGKPTFEESINRLLGKGKPIEAANLFLKVVLPRKDEAISWGRRALGYEIFRVNCKAGNTYIARSIYLRLDKVSVMDTQMWSSMIHLLAREGHVESAAAIFEQHRSTFTLPEYLLEVTLRCLLESNRLSQAKRLFYSRIEHDRNGGLCGTFLDGLWKKTRNVDVVNIEFRKIITELNKLGRQPTEKVFNGLVKAYIEAGQYEDAEAIVGDMEEKYGAKPGCRTIGLLLHCRALQCDWEGVIVGLHKMHERGFTKDKPNFNRVFDRVWAEYWPSHSGPDNWKFLQTYLQEFDIRPDNVLHRHLIEGMVERCDTETLRKFHMFTDARKWNTGIDHDAMLRILEARRVAMQDSPTGFWQMFQAAKKQHGMVAMSRRIMGVGAGYYHIEKNGTSPIRYEAKKSFSRSMKGLGEKSSINLYVPATKRMAHHIHVGKYTDAKQLLQQAVDKGYPVKPIQIQLGVIATLLHGGLGGLSEAQNMIKKLWSSWNKRPSLNYSQRSPRFVPIFFQQIMQLDPYRVSESTLIKLALFEFYEICVENERLQFKHHASNAVARRMIALQRPLVAVNLLSAIYISKWRKAYGFTQVQLKMLIRGYTWINNPRGLWWCMMTVLSRNEPVSRDFVVEVERLMPLIQEKHLPSTVETLQALLTALQEKQSGSSHWAQFTVDPELKKQGRDRISVAPGKSQELPDVLLEEALVAFDEEMEFEHVIDRKQFDQDELNLWWSERMTVKSHRRQPEHPLYPEHPTTRVM
ncbi:hypothetical protein N7478_007682 [Penicillium angulare]|uniref:uncharacterized protein n=1 Tax=Penicillium angulare TaxID=116970 RepID=UPI0025404733|nr:uncharacterized protein N7478_007682 [Penicillium angulare]KAJ5272557.1 hypothetical protein N7478_007682 [Penicillium angulare]